MPRNNQTETSQAPHPNLEILPRRLRNDRSLSCQFCNKAFRRLEHVQRHERTHTKEKPFKCHCGKNFARRDLLRRHTRLVHDESENRSHSSTPPEESMNDGSPTPDLQSQRHFCPLLIDPDLIRGLPNRNVSEVTEEFLDSGMRLASHAPKAGCRLDVLSDAALRYVEIPVNDQVDSQASTQSLPTLDSRAPRSDTRSSPDLQSHGEVQTNLGVIDDSHFNGQAFLMDNAYDFFDNLDFSAHAMFMPLNAEGSIDTAESSFLPNNENLIDGHLWTHPESNYNNRMGHFSNLQPAYPQQLQPPSPRISSFGERPRSGASFKISPQDYNRIRESINNFSEFLLNGFSMPPRHTLSRYVEGFFSAFNDHMPFLHFPTLCVGSWSPELSLAVAAVGAKYVFDSERSECLWHASRLICLEQIRRRHQKSSSSFEEDGRQPYSETQVPTITPGSLSDYDPDAIPYCQSRIETMQAFLILMTVASWGPSKSLKCSLSMQSQMAMLIREDGVQDSDKNLESTTWKDWVRIETKKRIKLIAYCIFVLQMVAYNIPPLLLNTEIFMTLPSSEEQWKAESEEQWRQIRRNDYTGELDFQECFQSLFLNSPEVPNRASSLGYFVLIHALLQHIFFVRQATYSKTGSLSPNEIDNLVHALKRWQEGCESIPQDSHHNPESPIAFNSSTLLRLAYTRLHSNLGPCRSLGTRNPKRIALSLKELPALCRGSRLNRAILQSVHALSIPIRNGVNFVARTQTFSWSIQHSLCNLEFALLLSKWFETIANTLVEQPLSSNEKSLISIVKTLLEETELAASFNDPGKTCEDEKVEMQQLGYTVIRLWAATFKGSHIFEIVEVIGAGLDEYADLLEGKSRVDS